MASPASVFSATLKAALSPFPAPVFSTTLKAALSSAKAGASLTSLTLMNRDRRIGAPRPGNRNRHLEGVLGVVFVIQVRVGANLNLAGGRIATP
jgi:hypothetical protein